MSVPAATIAAGIHAQVRRDPLWPRRSSYATDVLDGHASLSGADLRGRARLYGAGYLRMRKRVCDLVRAHGGHVRCDARERRRLTLVLAPAPNVPTTDTAVGLAHLY